MLVIYAIKASDTLIDLFFKEDFNLVWFGCLPGDCVPAKELDKIYTLINIIEPEYAHLTIQVFEYERKR